MIPEIGVFFLILALMMSVLLVLVPGLGFITRRQAWVDTASCYTVGQFICIAAAYCCLTLCFLRDDFSVLYVVSNSSLSLPWFYKLCAVWGGHEGSMLLWVAILSVWMLAVTFFSKQLEPRFRARVLIVLGIVSVGFLLFLLLTSNPFTRQFQLLNTAGRDLNPLLQDPGFLFHPPMLYMGYVGFSVAFAFAIAALSLGQLESQWVKWARPWTLGAWCCLTLGITLGSWWAYRELGWGGWWFWDPVENASFMPWLAGTALLHSLAVSEKRQQFIAWTLLLAITAFSLSLIGTFLVRSGVLTSVHAFAVDPQRGMFILGFLAFVIGGSLLLFALRAHVLPRQQNPGLISKESALLLNNVFLVVAMLTVLMGTVYPLLIDGLGLGKLSVGAPYFNAVFVPLMLPVLLLMGIGVHLNWQTDTLKRLMIMLLPVMAFSVLLPALIMFLCTNQFSFWCWLACAFALWIILSTFQLLRQRLKQQKWYQLNRAFLGMLSAHVGLACTVLGIAVSTSYGIQDDVCMHPGSSINLASYSLTFVEETPLKGPNYHGTQVRFAVSSHGRTRFIYPEKRIYDVANMPMTDSAIDVNPFRDIYVALGEPLDETAWSVRVYYKPLVRWIWGGGFMIFIGGFLAITDRRYASPAHVKSNLGMKEIRT